MGQGNLFHRIGFLSGLWIYVSLDTYLIEKITIRGKVTHYRSLDGREIREPRFDKWLTNLESFQAHDVKLTPKVAQVYRSYGARVIYR